MERLELEQLLLRLRAIEKRQLSITKKATLKKYNTGEKVHEKQLAFHRSQKRNRWVFGGNRSGKTECGAVEAVWLATGTHPYRPNRTGVEGWVVSLSYEVQRDVAQQKLLKYLPSCDIVDIVMEKGSKANYDRGIIDFIIVKNALGGTSKIGFKSCEAGREKFQGTSLDFVWFDEEPPLEIYEECKMRVLDKKGDIFGTMTPLKGLTWVYDDIFLNRFGDDEVWFVTMQWSDNPYLDVAEVEAMSKSMNEETLLTRRFGQFRATSSLVYPEFDEDVHVIDPFEIPYAWQDKLAIDPGLKNPLSCHFYAIDYDGNVYVVAEHYDKEKDIDYHAEKIKEIADSIGWKRNPSGHLEALIDSAAGQRTLASSKSVSELFYEKGIAVNPKVNKELFAGIMKVKDVFKSRPTRIFIFRNCVNLIRELKSYRWGENEVPIKRDDHSLDELRYYLMSHPTPMPEKEKSNVYKKHKESLMRQIRLQNARNR